MRATAPAVCSVTAPAVVGPVARQGKSAFKAWSAWRCRDTGGNATPMRTEHAANDGMFVIPRPN
jgi:hypothetical protein